MYSFVGHDNWVRGLALHPTGKYLYTASDDKTLRVWDLTYGKEKKKIDAHDHFISTVRFHRKYGVIATGGNDMVVKIWNLKWVDSCSIIIYTLSRNKWSEIQELNARAMVSCWVSCLNKPKLIYY